MLAAVPASATVLTATSETEFESDAVPLSLIEAEGAKPAEAESVAETLSVVDEG